MDWIADRYTVEMTPFFYVLTRLVACHWTFLSKIRKPLCDCLMQVEGQGKCAGNSPGYRPWITPATSRCLAPIVTAAGLRYNFIDR